MLKKIFAKNKMLNYSSTQQKESNLLTSKNNSNLYSNKDLMQYLKNSRNKKNSNPTTNNNKTIKKSIKCEITYFHAKTFEYDSNQKENDNKEDSLEKKNTSRIDYRHCKNYPIEDIIHLKNIKDENQKKYWLVTYDKLIKSKNIIKILNHNNSIIGKNNSISTLIKPIYTESNLIIKTMKIPKFELFFVKGYDKPFVKPNKSKNNFILAKLYLLNQQEINKIINFINRIDDKINIDNYIPMTKKNLYQYIDINQISNLENKSDFNYPYCYIYYLGKFMNIGMYLFTNTFNYIKKYNIKNNILYSLPSSKKLYKLIKILIKSFPEYKPDYIINNIIKNDLYQNSKEKKYEINNYLSLLKHSVPNKMLLNKILRDTITGIQPNSSISLSSLPFESGNLTKSSEITKKEIKISTRIRDINEIKKNISEGHKGEFKSSLNSMNNNYFLTGGQIATNYLSTNHTMMPSNSIRAYSNKHSIKNNAPFIAKPNEINTNKRKTYCRNLYKGKIIIPKNKNEIKKKSEKILINNFRNEENKESKENKENININNIINKKNDNNNTKFQNNKEKIDINGVNKNKQINKKGIKEDIKNEYHTPKKKKKIRYYK